MYDRIELVVGPNKRFTAQIHVLNNVFVYTVFVVNNYYRNSVTLITTTFPREEHLSKVTYAYMRFVDYPSWYDVVRSG